MTIASESQLATVDASDMLGAIRTLPAQLREGYARARDARAAIGREWPHRERAGRPGPRTLIVCGMGGSGVGGDLLGAAFDVGVPVIAVKGYELPSWASEDDCVVCVSYSGQTAETLSCFRAAVDRATVSAVITSGGELGQLAAQHGVPVVGVQSGMQPRAAVGVLFGSLAGVAEALNVIDDAEDAIESAARAAQAVIDLHVGAGDQDGMTVQLEDDPPALAMARQITDATAVIYGTGMTVPIAWRWKAQINENAKHPAFANAYPELDHNEIVGWERAGACGRWAVIELLGPDILPQNRQRMDVTNGIIEDDLVASLRFQTTALDRAGATFELIVWGDYLATYLALVNGVDPTPVDRIQRLKQELAGA